MARARVAVGAGRRASTCAVPPARRSGCRLDARGDAVSAILAIEDAARRDASRPRRAAGATRGPTRRSVAIRALGRLERRDVIPDLLPLLAFGGDARRSRDSACAGAARRARSTAYPAASRSSRARARCIAAGEMDLGATEPRRLMAPRARTRPAAVQDVQRQDAEAFLRRVLEKPLSAASTMRRTSARRAASSRSPA